MKKDSFWNDDFHIAEFPALQGDHEVDVLVVGAGITGVTTAYLLKQAGCRVAVIDQQRVGGGETSHTTAHLTHVADTRLHELASTVGENAAHALWKAGRLAMEQIRDLTTELEIECGWSEVPGYLFAAEDRNAADEAPGLERDALLASKFGFEAHLLESDPFFGRPAVRFPNQAKFHPTRYLAALAKAIPGEGSQVFSKTSASGLEAEDHILRSDKGTIRYGTLVAATHVPIQGAKGTFAATLFQTKLASYSTYVIGAEIEPRPEALFWDTDSPYHYWRFDLREDGAGLVIVGGEDHKTGQQPDTEGCYEKLEKLLRQKIPTARPTHRWSGQVVETPDGLPFIGEIGERQFLATGFSGNGITLGTFSAIMIREAITGHPEPWTEIFNPHRKRPAALWRYLRENKDFPLHFVKDHLAATMALEDIKPTTGAIVNIDGKKCAVSSDEQGNRTILSATCPHLGCIVQWNGAEKTWDCPCHGSRFTSSGDLIQGPAESRLETAESAQAPAHH